MIERFIGNSARLPLSYNPIGIAGEHPTDFTLDEAGAVIGHGAEAFQRARAALRKWRQFELGWVELFPRAASIEPDTNVAVLVRHLGFWSLNGCRVVYHLGDPEAGTVFGVAYGSLTNHAECGEELFEVSLNPQNQEVTYRIRAASKPRAPAARIGYRLTRWLQGRFRRDSIAAMVRAIAAD